MTTDQIGAAKPPAFYLGELAEHLRVIVDYLTAAGDRANATVPKDGSENTQMLRLSSMDKAITANTNNLDLDGFSLVRIDPDAAWDLTGILAGDDRFLILINVGAFTLTLIDQSGLSDVANRFEFGGSSFSLVADSSMIIWYDTTDSRWRQVSP